MICVVLYHACTNKAYKSPLTPSNKTLKQWNILIHKHYTETPYYVTCQTFSVCFYFNSWHAKKATMRHQRTIFQLSKQI